MEAKVKEDDICDANAANIDCNSSGGGITVHFEKLSFWTEVSSTTSNQTATIPTIGTTLWDWITLGSYNKQTEKHRANILQGLTGLIKPRRLTLLLGPPSCGKSLLMKLLSGIINRTSLDRTMSVFDGEICLNGIPLHSLSDMSGTIVDYVAQTDNHPPLLTVEEILRYAWTSTMTHTNPFGPVLPCDKEFDPVEDMLEVLDLINCKDTLVGDSTIRGISGGEKRRLTLAELLITPHPVKLMDSITDGLDAATALMLVRYLHERCRDLNHTYLVSLQQASSAIYKAFDDLILLNDNGNIIYCGSCENAFEYFAVLGYHLPDHLEEVEFFQALATKNAATLSKATPAIATQPSYDSPLDAVTMPLSSVWDKSALCSQLLDEIHTSTPSPHFQSTIFNHSSLSFFNPIPSLLLWHKAFMLMLFKFLTIEQRNRSFYKTRLIPTVVIAFFCGSLYQTIGFTDVFSMVGFMYINIMLYLIGLVSYLPQLYAHQTWHNKLVHTSMYPMSVFTIVNNLISYPLFLIETILQTTILYWLVGLAPDLYGSRFAFFILTIVLFTICMTSCFRCVVILCMNNQTDGVALCGGFILIGALFSGFVQPINVTPNYFKWLFYCNPGYWSVTALTINEYKSSHNNYDTLQCTTLDCSIQKRFGDLALEQYGNPTDDNYKWFCLLIVFCIYIFVTIIVNALLHRAKYRTEVAYAVPPVPVDSTVSTLASASSCGKVQAPSDGQDVEIGSHHNTTSETMLSLLFTPVTLTFQRVDYAIPGRTKDVSTTTLLSNVSGFFEPGTMTALMGATGAGKTTLLDVLSMRKTQGTCKGDIRFNGKLTTDHANEYKSIIAYVEQFDSLSAYSTVRECIEFSAQLRLPLDIVHNIARISQWVDNVLSMLELTDLADRMIGSVTQHSALSFEQRKRVSIAFEFAANPSAIFLDEPTTGLDFHSADIVITNIRAIANSGRTVVCTIHQPSPSVFQAFDKLLLLQKGGRVVYFGDIGHDCQAIVNFFKPITRDHSISGKHPSAWMLETVNSHHCSHEEENCTEDNLHSSCSEDETMERPSKPSDTVPTVDLPRHFRSSDVWALVDKRLNSLILQGTTRYETLTISTDRSYLSVMLSMLLQCRVLLKRFWLSYWRNPSYSLITRGIVYIMFSIIFAMCYVNFECKNVSDVMAFMTILLVTVLGCGSFAMQTSIPIAEEEKSVFVREQQSTMYSPLLYCITQLVVEIPFVIMSTFAGTVPFFFMVGLHDNYDTSEYPISAKFGYFWIFVFLIILFNVSFGQCLVAWTSNASTAQSFASMAMSIFSAFSGFMIRSNSIPFYWRFVYWANPYHYAFEGVVVTQFHRFQSTITLWSGKEMTAEHFISENLPDWKFAHVNYCLGVLGGVVVSTCLLRYIALRWLTHEKR